MKLGFLGERASLDQTRLSNRRNFHCTFYRHVPKRCERELTRCQEITLQTYWLIRHLWDFQTRQQLARVCRETPMPRSQTQVSVQQQDRSFNQSLVNAQCTKSNLNSKAPANCDQLHGVFHGRHFTGCSICRVRAPIQESNFLPSTAANPGSLSLLPS